MSIEEIKLSKPKTKVNERGIIGKYVALYDYLRMVEEAEVTLTYKEIESIIGFTLPDSAHKHRAWWSNDITHSQAKAWLIAEWEVERVVSSSHVSFIRCLQ